MKRVLLGKTGMRISLIGFGGIPIQRLREEEAVRLIRGALDLGIDWIDTAHGYNNSEIYIGKALEGRDRSAVKLFSKGPGKTVEDLRRQFDLSCERLKTDTLDLYQLHYVSSLEVWEKMQADGVLDFVRDLKKCGRVRHIGASAHSAPPALALLDCPDIEVLQYPLNFMQEAEVMEVLKKCRARGKGFIAMKPFGGGLLNYAPACIRFLLQFPDIVADPGFEKLEQVEEVVNLVSGPGELTEEDRRRMERIKQELGPEFCRRCGYCQPCAQKVDIITLMTMETLIRRLDPRILVKGFARAAVESVEGCTECGECESRCPYHLPIRSCIKAGASAFKKVEASIS